LLKRGTGQAIAEKEDPEMDTLEKNQKISQDLGGVLADHYLVYLKSQSYHWNVTGPHFFSLHNLFEKIYQDLAAAIDELAERIRALGAFAPGTFQEFNRHSEIQHGPGVPTAELMLKDLSGALRQACRRCDAARAQAADAGDSASEDLLIRRIGALENWCWMLNSHL
jgi:starvation-inducible DNA-binding protein